MTRTISLMISLLLPLPVCADMAPLVSNTKVLGNGKYLLVRLYPKTNSLNGNNKLNDEYAQSGLYANDATRKLIWALPAPAEGEVFLSPDSDFFANIVYPTECNGDGLRFYQKGKLIRAYKITELAHPSSIQEACPSCIWRNDAKFDDVAETLAITVRDGRTWTFNIRTGEATVVRGENAGVVALFANGDEGPGVLLLAALAAGLFGLLAICGIIGAYWYWQRTPRVETAK